MPEATPLLTQQRQLTARIATIYETSDDNGKLSRVDEIVLLNLAGELAIVAEDLDKLMTDGSALPSQWGHSCP